MTNEELLRSGLKTLKLKASDEQIRLFLVYLAELNKWSKVYNLTSIKGDREIIINHFLDSCLYLKAINSDTLSIADVGSGAGFPGIPMKIMRPELTVALIEPSRKKASFMRLLIDTLGLQNVRVIEESVEDVPDDGFDAVLTRALFSLGDFVRKAGHLLCDGGVFIVSKGPRLEEELEGFHAEFNIITEKLPFSTAERRLVIIKKTARRHDKLSDPLAGVKAICTNAECKLRKAGCKGFEACPGFKSR